MKSTWLLGGIVMSVALAAGVNAQPQNAAGGQPGTITITGCLQQGGAVGTSGSNSTGTPSAPASAGGQFVLTNARMGMPAATPPATTAAPTGTAAGGAAAPEAAAPGADGGGKASGGAASGPAALSGSSYLLDGQHGELRTHVGQQVEITGRLASGGGSGPAATPPGGVGTPSGAGATSSGTGAPTGAIGGTTSGTTSDTQNGTVAGGTTAGAGTQSSRGTTAGLNQPRIDVQSVKMIASTCAR